MERWVAIVLGLILTGCGTTHHFLPAQPLPRSHSEISLTWSYTFGRDPVYSILPTFNVYAGVGKNWNLGGGLQMGYLIPHLTAAKYWEQTKGRYLAAFVHANQPMSVTENPYLELGIATSKSDRDLRSMIMAGLAYGHGGTSKYGLATLKNDMLGMGKKRFMPFLKGQMRVENMGFSYSWYPGKSSAALAGLTEEQNRVNPIVVSYEAGEIDSIRLDDGRDLGHFQEVIRFHLSNGSIDEFWGPERFTCGNVRPCGMGLMLPLWFGFLPHWITYDQKFQTADPDRWSYNNENSAGMGKDGNVVYSSSSDFLNLNLDSAITIRRYGKLVTDYLARNFNQAADHSFGFSIYPIMPERESVVIISPP